MRPHSRLCLTTLISAALFLSSLFPFSGIAQQPPEQSNQDEERVVEKMWRKPGPLEVMQIKTASGNFALGQKFAGDDTWFQTISAVLENTYNKKIVYIGAGFLFPRPQGEAEKGPPFYQQVSYGRHPQASIEGNLRIPPLSLKPDERITISMADSSISSGKINAALRQLKYTQSIKLIKLNLEEIYFDDGSAWVAGTWFRSVPEHKDDSPPEQQLLRGKEQPKPSLPLSFSVVNFGFQKLPGFFCGFANILPSESERPAGRAGPVWHQ